MAKRPLRLDETALESATASVLESRGFGYARTPEEGQDAYDITVRTREEVRIALETYLGTLDPLPAETAVAIRKLQDLVFGPGMGKWQENPECHLVFEVSDALRTLAHREKARRLDPLPLAELSSLVEDKLKPLSGLYSKGWGDWVIEIHHILTEPTCPTATIRPENSNAARYSVHRDTVVEAIAAAADLVYREQVLGQPITPESPITNPDDRERPLA